MTPLRLKKNVMGHEKSHDGDRDLSLIFQKLLNESHCEQLRLT